MSEGADPERETSAFMSTPAGFAMALASLMTMAFASDAVPPPDGAATAACPNLVAHIVSQDYDGEHVVQRCVSSFSITPGAINIGIYDNQTDGLFHNDFESAL